MSHTYTFDQIWQEVHGHSLAVDPLLVQSWVRDTWREVAEYRTWSWLRKKSALAIAAPYTTGTVACTPGDPVVTFTGATLTDSMVGRQFRIGSDGAVYDVIAVDISNSKATLEPAWVDTATAVTGKTYKIFTAYIEPPDTEFFAWIAVKDPNRKKRLRLHVNQETIDYWDSARKVQGLGPACLSGIDWTRRYAGKVHTAIRITGSDPLPSVGGQYSGQNDAVFIIRITSTGAADTAQFSWQKDSGTTYTGFTTSTTGNAIGDGVVLTWSGSFTNGTVYVVRVTAKPQYGAPRYELYPHPTEAKFLTCTYATRVPEIDSPDFTFPYTIRADVIKCGALAKMARYPGTDQKPNPFAQVARAQYFEEKFQMMLAEQATSDDYLMETNVLDGTEQWEEALLPWMSASGSGFRPTADYDPLDLLRY